MFIGRQEPLSQLESFYKKKGQFAVIFGRRRIGKSELIKKFCHKKKYLYFEGIENARTPKQIEHFSNTLKGQIQEPLLQDTIFKTWDAAFGYLTSKISKSDQTVLVFDELQWMAAKKSHLIALIKYYWDNHWKKKNIMLILCGSIASFMIKNVIKSKALYGRINLQINLKGFLPHEARQLLQNRSQEEVIKYLMLFGGVPKYLEEINTQTSFDFNIDRLCFRKDGVMVDEFEKIFYGQFNEAKLYLKIIRALSNGPKLMSEIAKKTQIPSGGGLKTYITNLMQAEFISEVIPFGSKRTTKLKKYRISDEYLNFHFKYIEPNLKSIHIEGNKKIFQKKIKPQWQSWLGLCFEKFCIKHAIYLAKLMKFADEVIDCGPYFEKKPGFQIDLLYERTDKVLVLCEIKFHTNEISTEIIPEIESKLKHLKVPRGYTVEKALISLYGQSPALQKSQYFQHNLTLHQILDKS